jgi:hypothetical protein
MAVVQGIASVEGIGHRSLTVRTSFPARWVADYWTLDDLVGRVVGIHHRILRHERKQQIQQSIKPYHFIFPSPFHKKEQKEVFT